MANINQTLLAELEAEKEKVCEDCPHTQKLLTEGEYGDNFWCTSGVRNLYFY